MALSAYAYGNFSYNLTQNNINDLADAGTEIRCALLSDSYTPSQNIDDSWSDVSEHEIEGEGYNSGGEEITNKSLEQIDGATIFDGDNPEWTNTTLDARWAVFYDDTPTGDTDKKLISYVDFGEVKSTSDATFRIEIDDDGIARILALQD